MKNGIEFESEEQASKFVDTLLKTLEENDHYVGSGNSFFNIPLLQMIKDSGFIKKSPLEDAREKAERYVEKTQRYLLPAPISNLIEELNNEIERLNNANNKS